VGIARKGRRAECERFPEFMVVWTRRPGIQIWTCLGMRRSGGSLSTRHRCAWFRPASVSERNFISCPPFLSSQSYQEMLRHRDRAWSLDALIRHPTRSPKTSANDDSLEGVEQWYSSSSTENARREEPCL
jgi:hypothetical protein